MNNKSLKKLMLFFILLLIIAAIVIIMIISYLNTSESQNPNINVEEGGEDFSASYGKEGLGGVDKQAYFDIISCMKKYLNTTNLKSGQYGSYDEQDNYVLAVEESEIKQKIYNLLSEKYINKNNINLENLYNHVEVLQESTEFILLEASLVQDGRIKSFITYGLIGSTDDYTIIDEFFALVNINFYDAKFSIEPIHGDYTSISEINIEEFETTINSNEDNQFKMSYTTKEDVPEQYINLYKRLALGYPKKMYDLLDEEYREAKFGSLDNFKNYIKENKEKIERIRLDKYQAVANGNNAQYICVDQNEKYYIFNQNVVLQDYTVILDTYTIDLPEFIEKYTTATNQEKVGMNIEKVLAAINDGDYKYVYSKLDNTFKQNKFPSESNLQTYIKNNFSENNNIEYLDFSQEGNIFIYKTKINGKNFNIIMQLGEGTEFAMSFSFE